MRLFAFNLLKHLTFIFLAKHGQLWGLIKEEDKNKLAYFDTQEIKSLSTFNDKSFIFMAVGNTIPYVIKIG